MKRLKWLFGIIAAAFVVLLIIGAAFGPKPEAKREEINSLNMVTGETGSAIPVDLSLADKQRLCSAHRSLHLPRAPSTTIASVCQSSIKKQIYIACTFARAEAVRLADCGNRFLSATARLTNANMIGSSRRL